MAKKMLLLALLCIVALYAVGCQTVAGVGGDIKWTAEATADLLEGE